MPKKTNINTLIDRYNASMTGDLKGWIEEMKQGSDRVAAIVGATLLDEQLRTLLLSHFVDERTLGKSEGALWGRLFGPEGSLGTSASRSTVALALGLIPMDLYEDLQGVRRIRNVFAHGLHGLDFQHPEVAVACEQLQTACAFLPPEWQKDLTPRVRYIITVSHASLELDGRAQYGTKRCVAADNTLFRFQWNLEREPGKEPMANPFLHLDSDALGAES